MPRGEYRQRQRASFEPRAAPQTCCTTRRSTRTRKSCRNVFNKFSFSTSGRDVRRHRLRRHHGRRRSSTRSRTMSASCAVSASSAERAAHPQDQQPARSGKSSDGVVVEGIDSCHGQVRALLHADPGRRDRRLRHTRLRRVHPSPRLRQRPHEGGPGPLGARLVG